MSNENENFIYFDRESGELMIKRSFIEDKFYKENWGHQIIDIVFELAGIVAYIKKIVEHLKKNTDAYWKTISLAQNIMQIYPNIHSHKGWNEALLEINNIVQGEFILNEDSIVDILTLKASFWAIQEALQYHMKECTTQELD